LQWYDDRERKRVHNEYRELCREKGAELIRSVSEGVQWIKLDSGESSNPHAASLYYAFGGAYEWRLFGFPGSRSTYNNWGQYKNIENAAIDGVGSYRILRVRSSRHVPYVGTFYVMEIDIEIVDPGSMAVVAHRRTFTTGTPDQESARDCAGHKLHEENLAFLQPAIKSPLAISRDR
jgi:hypothetical protein